MNHSEIKGKAIPEGFEPAIWCAKLGTPLYVYDADGILLKVKVFKI